MKSKIQPDYSSRPNKITWEGLIEASPERVYEAWTSKFDLWFAQSGETLMTPEVDRPFFFYNKTEWGRHPHYGRFLDLKQNEVVEMTWLTGNGDQIGTQGAETTVRVELEPKDSGTYLKFTQFGFANEKSMDDHKEAWPYAFEELKLALKNQALNRT